MSRLHFKKPITLSPSDCQEVLIVLGDIWGCATDREKKRLDWIIERYFNRPGGGAYALEMATQREDDRLQAEEDSQWIYEWKRRND